MYRFTMTILAATAAFLIATMAWAAPEAPGDLKLGPPEGWTASKPLVGFSHAGHGKTGIECATCHHTWDGQGAIQGCGTAGCHDQPGKKGSNAFYTAFHSKKADASCLGCHKKTNKRDNTKLPVGCKNCHSK